MVDIPKDVSELIARFEQNIDSYQSQAYNETQVRLEFINPFFEALGWDVTNKAGYAEPYKDVIHEDAVKVGGATKAPDYSFRIGGSRKFFLEAKKPAISIKDDTSPAYQLRRYAWSAKLPLSILTNFAEFAVYDCRLPPKESDKASIGRVLYFTYKDYAAHWEQIASIFSKQAVLQGSFDKFAEAGKGKKGTSQVDAEFLTEIEGWREALAKNIALRNPKLTVRDLNFSVQRTIDRIIFLRMCEDRGVEHYGQLLALLNGENTYKRLQYHYGLADDKYNSGLFHFRPEKDRAEAPDELTLKLKIDDKVLKEIIRRLYYPDSPYEFSVLGADILGNVYEQFLGKVIRLTAGHHAVVEDKPEVKKAGGVYYTPAYIVEYIVKNTVGKLCESKTPKQIEKLKILDPACGSGSFLIGAYTYLLNHHRDWYVKDGLQKHTKEIYQGSGGQWLLTTQDKKRILLNNIYGVDIDSQAVEVTKLSLLLKVLEGESEETIGKNLKLFRERALPDLGNNIKCGNSLIGPDFYQNQQLSLLDEEEHYRINIFDWDSEFREIMTAGGFDAVIGNPPYLNVDDTWGRGDKRLAALKALYPQIYNDKTDILFYFLAKATQLSKGYVSFIISRAFLEAYKADKLRRYLLANSSVKKLVDFRNFYVFPGVGITTCITVTQPKAKPGVIEVYKLRGSSLPASNLESLLSDAAVFEKLDIKQSELDHAPWSFSSKGIQHLNAKIDGAGKPLGQILLIGQGMQTGRNDVFGERTLKEITKWRLKNQMFYKRASNSDIQRFYLRDRGEYVLFLEDEKNFDSLPKGVQKHLKEHSADLKERAAYQRGDCEWWKYTWPLHKEWYSRSKILCPYLAQSNRFALDVEDEYLGLTDTTVLFDNNQKEDMRFILGLLNSKLLTFRFRSIGKLKSGGIIEYFWNSVSKLPVRVIDFSKTADKSRHDKIVMLVERVLDLNKDAAKARNPNEKDRLQREIDATDRQIDQLVYELYGLTEEEIKIVGEATNK